MSTRTIADIDADIAAVKNANPNWLTNSGDKALITSLTNEKNILSVQPGNYPVPRFSHAKVAQKMDMIFWQML